MARVRMTLEDIRAIAADDVDAATLHRTTEADIARHAVEDGEIADEDAPSGRIVVPPALVRSKTGLTQEQFARALHIPVKTLRNWEQGRTRPDPAANSLFRLVNADPEKMLGLLQDAKAAS